MKLLFASARLFKVFWDRPISQMTKLIELIVKYGILLKH